MDLEILFWKIIRNVVIFRKIFSNINEYSIFKYGVYKYHQIISVEDMIENKNFNGLLKYKVKRNEHLSFTYFKLVPIISKYVMVTEPSTNLNDRIYSTIRDDQEFYNCLFKFYPDQFKLDLSKDNIKSTINKIIEYDCLGGLKELIDNYNFGKLITEKHYIMAFSFNSFKVLEYLHKNFKFKISPLKYYNEIKKNTPNHSKIKKNFNNEKDMKFLNINGQIGFLINLLGYSNPNKSDIPNLIYSINQDIWKITLQQLIDSCITVSFLKLPLNQYIKSIKEFIKSNIVMLIDRYEKDIIELYLNHINGIDQLSLLSIDEINKIKSLFTNEQLSTKLDTIESNQFELGQLFKFILPFIGIGESLYSNLRYYYIKFIKSIDQLGILPKSSQNYQTIFKYFQFSKSKQDNHKYLLMIINEYKFNEDGNEYIDSQTLNVLERLLEIFIEQEDHNCLVMVLNLIPSNEIPVFIVSMIQSKETFQLLYNHHNCDIKKLIIEIIENYIEILNPKVMEFYQELYPIEYKELLNNQINSEFIINSLSSKCNYYIKEFEINLNYNEEMCWFIYNNDYLSNEIISNHFTNLKLSSYKQFKFFFQNTYDNNPPNESLEFSSKLIYIEFSRIEKINLFHYLCNDYDRLFGDITDPTLFFENSKLLFSLISRYGDIIGLSNILSTYFPLHSYTNNLQFISFLDTFYVFSCLYNQISIIEFVHLNYPYLFSEIDQRTINFCKHTIIKNDSQRSKLYNFFNNR